MTTKHLFVGAFAALMAVFSLASIPVTPVSATLEEEVALSTDQERPRAELKVPDTLAGRALLSANTSIVFDMINDELGLADTDAITMDKVLTSVFERWQENKAPMAEVAAVLRAERRLRAEQEVSVQGGSPTYGAVLFAPYLIDAGLCTGSATSPNGMVCSYVDRAPGAARVRGQLGQPNTNHAHDLLEPPQGSQAAQILAMSRSDRQLVADAESEQTQTTLKLNRLLASAMEHVVPAAHAQVPDTPANDTATDTIRDCIRQDDVSTNTMVLKLDPYEFGLVLFQETIGRLDIPTDNDITNQLVHAALRTIVKNAVSYTQGRISESFTKRSNASADNAAKRACQGVSEDRYEDCYFNKYEEVVLRGEIAAPLLNTLIKFGVYSAAQGVGAAYFSSNRTADADDNAISAYCKEEIRLSCSDIVVGALTPFIQVDVYGENYTLVNVQTPGGRQATGGADGGALGPVDNPAPTNDPLAEMKTPEPDASDQVFAMVPYGFTCKAHKCPRISQCGIQYGNVLECAERFATPIALDMRDRGGYIEHSINTCAVQAADYSGRVGYRAIRAQELAFGTTGLPNDFTLKTTFQTPPPSGADPNDCEEGDEGADESPDSPREPGSGTNHLCPFPTSKTGPTNPATPLFGVRQDDQDGAIQRLVADILAGNVNVKQEEDIPFWRWDLEKVAAPIDNYSLIYAGLDSTSEAYDATYQLPGASMVLPQCSATRQINGVESAPGHAFWAWHGEQQRNSQPSLEVFLTMMASTVLQFRELAITNDQRDQAIFVSLLVTAAAESLVFSINRDYSCDQIPFKHSASCPNGDSFISAGTADFFPMPETNVILAQTLNHDGDTCETGERDEPGEGEIVAFGGEIAEGSNEDENTVYTFDVERMGSTDAEASVQYQLIAGTATADDDYVDGAGTIYFARGQASQDIEVEIIADTDIEPDETFFLELSDPSGATLDPENARVDATITNDDSSNAADDSTLVITRGGTVSEGDGPGQQLSFEFFKLGNIEREVRLAYRTVNGTASAGQDYQSTSGVLTIPAGINLGVVNVPVVGDFRVETDETLFLNATLETTQNVLFGGGGAPGIAGTIENDDAPFVINVLPGQAVEGDSGSTMMPFTVTRTGDTSKRIPVYYGATDGTATGGHDFVRPVSGSNIVWLEAGDAETTIEIEVLGEREIEEDETFSLIIVTFASDLPFVFKQTTGVILNDDVFVNSPPVANDDTSFVAEDSFVHMNVLGNDSDPDDHPIRVLQATKPANGTATVMNSGAYIRYQPDADYAGTDSFKYTISDDHGGVAEATVTVRVLNKNDPPQTEEDRAVVSEDDSILIDVLLNDSDRDGDSLSVAQVDNPRNGTARILMNRVEYRPRENWFGTEVFYYTASDPQRSTARGKITVTVASINDAPVARDDSYATNEDVARVWTVLSNDYDADGDTLTVTAVGPASSGVATLSTSNRVRYQPNPNFFGNDSFTYTISDGKGGTATATVRVRVNPVNDAPTVTADAAETTEDTATTIDVLANDTDPEDGKPALFSVSTPRNGTATIVSGKVRYTPRANYSGTDSFSYTVRDSGGIRRSANVTVAIASINDAPVARDDRYTTNEDVAAAWSVLSNDYDADGDTLTVTAVGPAKSGVATLSTSNRVRYQPNPNFFGNDSFTYTISDGKGGTATATVRVRVNPVNDAPMAVSDAAETTEDTATIIDVLANDTDPEDGKPALFSVATPRNGTATIVSGKVRYTPRANYSGTDSFSYTVRDSGGVRRSATVTVTVAPVNDAPNAVNDGKALYEDQPVTILPLSNDSDPDGDELTIALHTQGLKGAAVLSADRKSIRYTPTPNQTGTDSFTYTISDGNTGTDTATIYLYIIPVNDAPNAVDDVSSTDEDRAVTVNVLLNDTDPDGDTLSLHSVGPVAHGSAVKSGNSVRYTPPTNFNGQVTFQYTVKDRYNRTDTATVTIQVRPVQDPPRAISDYATTPEDQARVINVTSNDYDPDGDALRVITATKPANGVASIEANGTSVRYVPTLNFSGFDRFNYTISDGKGGTATARVTVRVYARNDAPTAVDDAATVHEGESVRIYALKNDSDPEGNAISIVGNSAPSNGRVGRTSSYLTYTPNAGFSGTDRFTYTISDGSLTDTANVVVTVESRPSFLKINSGTVVEGNSGSQSLVFRVTRFGGISESSSVTFSTSGGTAHSQTDYLPVSGQTLTFAPNQVVANATVTVYGDTAIETAETVVGRLANAHNATISVSSATGTIIDDDKPSSPDTVFSVSPASGAENGPGTTRYLNFRVNRAGPPNVTRSVYYRTQSGTATSGADYRYASGRLVFSGTTMTKTVRVTIYNDMNLEGPELMSLRLYSPSTGATIGTATASGLIMDDDATHIAIPTVPDPALPPGGPGNNEYCDMLVTQPRGTGTACLAFACATDQPLMWTHCPGDQVPSPPPKVPGIPVSIFDPNDLQCPQYVGPGRDACMAIVGALTGKPYVPNPGAFPIAPITPQPQPVIGPDPQDPPCRFGNSKLMLDLCNRLYVPQPTAPNPTVRWPTKPIVPLRPTYEVAPDLPSVDETLSRLSLRVDTSRTSQQFCHSYASKPANACLITDCATGEQISWSACPDVDASDRLGRGLVSLSTR